jgi:hypothetical protein
MNCKDCKNYEPKEQRPVVKVESWYYGCIPIGVPKHELVAHNIAKATYTFTGQPDWKRIIRETFDKGAEVVRVTPVKGRMLDHMEWYEAVEIVAKYDIGHGTIRFPNGSIEPYFFCWNHISDADIEAAIREHHKAQDDRDPAGCHTCLRRGGLE